MPAHVRDQFDAAARAQQRTALAFLRQRPGPWVVKTDGLAAGKGVLVCTDLTEAEHDVHEKLSGSAFGAAGRTVVVEECLEGPELSILAVCDGQRAVALAPAQDFKRALDGDEGPNTGGMGAYSPVPIAGDDVVAILVARPGTRPTQSDLDEFVTSRLPAFKRPVHYRVVDALPRKELGRIDRAADSETAPADRRTMQASLAKGEPTLDPADWAFEMKWDGIRAIAEVSGGGIRLVSRNGIDVTGTYPELDVLGDRIGNAVLDVVLEPGFLDRVKAAGLGFKQRLAELQDRYPEVIAEIRGDGLMLGLRGAVPIVLATFPVLAGAPGASRIFDLVFFIVALNAVLPGMIDTRMLRDLARQLAGDEEAGVAFLATAAPAGRTGQPEEVAAVVAFLCSDDASFVHGVGWAVDGGALATMGNAPPPE